MKSKQEDHRLSAFFESLFDVLIGIIGIAQLLYFSLGYISNREFGDGNLHCYVCLGVMVLFAFSLIRHTVVFNKPLREAYWAKGNEPSFKSNLSFVLHQKQFWIKAAILALVYLILPLNWTFKALADVFQKGDSFADKLIALAVLYPVLLALAVMGHLSAYQFWNGHKESAQYSKDENNRETILIVAIYVVGAFVLNMAIPILIPLLGQLPLLKLAAAVAVLILLFWAYRQIRAYGKRRSCIRQLQKICAEKGYTVPGMHKLHSPVFKACGEGEDFQITVGQKNYSCKFICARKKYTPLFIHPNGSMTFVSEVRFLKLRLFQFTTTYQYGYESSNAKILIVNPTPKQMYTHQDGRADPIDNGDVIGGYKVFTATAFLRALEHDVLDK